MSATGSTESTSHAFRGAIQRNQRTVAAYEGEARNYARLCGSELPAQSEKTLRTFVAALPRFGRILEVGSGTGHDADFVEHLGIEVRRTDATRAFCEIQAERGKQAELLNVITDDLGGPYDGVMALCVLIHVDPVQFEAVLGRIRDALAPDGVFLASMREGTGAEVSGPWFTALWHEQDLTAAFEGADLQVEWTSFHIDGSGDRWLTYMVRRTESS
ncbi:class I SAM-dependent methyltransferase [Streptomyces sp. SID13031]|uniref:class I SAM-dependent methyltransferase n=1 Tax=Streptomyces sp. SID13031 TaxID=2706046 RepID=UPI0013C6C49A|nr:class I SAM-dependent methyltransferase [Streptomyces sp. SID13031]NEA31275.1 class I SAM-dependent methyltransferase [Streptomyces sp. SID13031]